MNTLELNELLEAEFAQRDAAARVFPASPGEILRENFVSSLTREKYDL